MHFLIRRLALPAIVVAFAATAPIGIASADDMMKTGDAMVSDSMKADCIKKAEMETDAMKKKDMMAACDQGAMSGDSMKSNDGMTKSDDGTMKSDDAMTKKN